jgi:hypothetical protein
LKMFHTFLFSMIYRCLSFSDTVRPPIQKRLIGYSFTVIISQGKGWRRL